jgi:hypothetical protein
VASPGTKRCRRPETSGGTVRFDLGDLILFMLTVYRKRAGGAPPTVANPTDSLGAGDRQYGAGDHRDVPRVQ